MSNEVLKDSLDYPKKQTGMSKEIKIPKSLKGKYVTRAAFAKLQGEKNRLFNDIKAMVENKDGSGGVVWNKWRKYFKKQNLFNEALREFAKKELPKLLHRYPDLGEPKLDSNPGAFK